MYKNFNLTDQERREIMEQHKSHGYKKPLNEQMENGVDPQDPAHHFGTVEKALIPKGFKKDISMLKAMGSEDLINGGGHGGIIVRYYSPVHPESKKKGYVVELIVNNVSKKKWGNGVNMYEVIKEVEKYLENKKPLNEQNQITSVSVPDEFPKLPYFSKLPNTSDGGKKVMLDGGGSDVLYPNGKTKSGKCWCHQVFKNSDNVGIIITSCDGIENHCKDSLNEDMEQVSDCSKLKEIPKSGLKGLTGGGKPQRTTWKEDIAKIANATTVYYFEGPLFEAAQIQRKCHRSKTEVIYSEFKRPNGQSYTLIGIN